MRISGVLGGTASQAEPEEQAEELLLPAGAAESDYVERNRIAWDEWAPGHVLEARKAWADEDLRWGLWGIPESELLLLEGIGRDSDVIELGCGTAAVSAWLARRGARPVAVDISRKQLATAEELQQRTRNWFPLVWANAEAVLYEDASFDLAISEYGASLWCNPRRWLPEARRLLRPRGTLVFFTNSSLLMLCTPADGGPVSDRLVRDYFGRERLEFVSNDAVEFHLTHGRWVQLLRESGFTLEKLIEVRPPASAKPRFEFASIEWARRWPSEEIWVARCTDARVST